jgi:hypothetical protein
METADRRSQAGTVEWRGAARALGWGGNVRMKVALAAAGIGLAQLDSCTIQPDQQLDSSNRPGEGSIVRSEVLRLWSPGTLISLADRQARSPVVRDHGGLRRFLEAQNEEGLWYALTMRGHQVNGDFADITFIRRPYEEHQHFPEFLAVLAAVAGNPPDHSIAGFSTATIQVLSEEISGRGPHEFIRERLGHPSPGLAQNSSRSSRVPLKARHPGG